MTVQELIDQLQGLPPATLVTATPVWMSADGVWQEKVGGQELTIQIPEEYPVVSVEFIDLFGEQSLVLGWSVGEGPQDDAHLEGEFGLPS